MNLADKIRGAEHVFIVGNGGSHSNAIHIANDLISVGVRAHTIDPATLTAIANDFGYENTFSRWLSVMGSPNDLLIALSGSGTSPNILNAIKMADQIGMPYVLITDYLRTMDMQESEEHQLYLGHEAMRSLRG